MIPGKLGGVRLVPGEFKGFAQTTWLVNVWDKTHIEFCYFKMHPFLHQTRQHSRLWASECEFSCEMPDHVWDSSMTMAFNLDRRGSVGVHIHLNSLLRYISSYLYSWSPLRLLQCWSVPSCFFKAHETQLPTEGALDSQREALLWRVGAATHLTQRESQAALSNTCALILRGLAARAVDPTGPLKDKGGSVFFPLYR